MASPIKQVELQQELLKELLHENREVILSKLLGFKQQSFRFRCWDNLCAVSSSAIIDRDSMPNDISKKLVKTEFLVETIKKVMNLKTNIFKVLSIDSRPDFSEEELKSITSFLMGQLSDDRVIEKVEPKAVVDKSNVVVGAVLQCKSCGEKSDYTAQYGRYGYFIKCNKCETNTAMKLPCFSCASKKTKVSKKKEVYTLHCSDCEQGTVLI
jgi:hypothetical protein